MKTPSFALRLFIVSFLMMVLVLPSASQTLPKRKHDHSISMDSAKKLIGNLKLDAVQMKTKGGLFYREVFDAILSQKNVVAIRYYYAKMDDGTPTIVMVGVDSSGRDLTRAMIAEKSYPCPPYCDLESTIGN